MSEEITVPRLEEMSADDLLRVVHYGVYRKHIIHKMSDEERARAKQLLREKMRSEQEV